VSSDRFQKVKDLFRAVIGTPDVDREDAIARTCPDDRELREGVRRVLTLVDRSGQLGPDVVDSLLWEASAPQAPSPEPAKMTFKPLEMLGRYCIIGQIGEGGMGLVAGCSVSASRSTLLPLSQLLDYTIPVAAPPGPPATHEPGRGWHVVTALGDLTRSFRRP